MWVPGLQDDRDSISRSTILLEDTPAVDVEGRSAAAEVEDEEAM